MARRALRPTRTRLVTECSRRLPLPRRLPYPSPHACAPHPTSPRNRTHGCRDRRAACLRANRAALDVRGLLLRRQPLRHRGASPRRGSASLRRRDVRAVARVLARRWFRLDMDAPVRHDGACDRISALLRGPRDRRGGFRLHAAAQVVPPARRGTRGLGSPPVPAVQPVRARLQPDDHARLRDGYRARSPRRARPTAGSRPLELASRSCSRR